MARREAEGGGGDAGCPAPYFGLSLTLGPLGSRSWKLPRRARTVGLRRPPPRAGRTAAWRVAVRRHTWTQAHKTQTRTRLCVRARWPGPDFEHTGAILLWEWNAFYTLVVSCATA
eukprot:scaffold18597_cov100-Isochrysis_galbana.AAC.4